MGEILVWLNEEKERGVLLLKMGERKKRKREQKRQTAGEEGTSTMNTAKKKHP